MVPFFLNVIVIVWLIEIFILYFHTIFSNLCADILIKVSLSVIITWSSAKRRVFVYFLFLYPLYIVRFHFESISFMYVFSVVGEGDQL